MECPISKQTWVHGMAELTLIYLVFHITTCNNGHTLCKESSKIGIKFKANQINNKFGGLQMEPWGTQQRRVGMAS